MKAQKILSKIALILAIIMSFSLLAACDLGDDNKERKKDSSKVKLYFYEHGIPDIEDVDEDGWTSASKAPLWENIDFHPDSYAPCLFKAENTTKNAMAVNLFFKVKGEVNPIADELYLSVTVKTEDGRTVSNTNAVQLGALLDEQYFSSFILGAKETYYVSITLYATSFRDSYDDNTLGAKLYLSCDANKTTQNSPAPLPSEVATTAPREGSVSENETYSYGEDVTHTETKEKTSAIHTESETEEILEHYTQRELYCDGTSFDWQSINHSDNSKDALVLNIMHDGFIKFTMSTSSEGGCDKLTVYINGNYVYDVSGDMSQDCCYEVFAGDVVELIYSKDGSASWGDDTAYAYKITLEQDIETEVETETSLVDLIIPEEPNTDIDGVSFDEIVEFDYGRLYNEDENVYDEIVYSVNQSHSSTSVLTVSFTQTGYITFSVRTSSQQDYDYLYVMHNGNEVYTVSGDSGWSGEICVDVRPGDVVTFIYSKDDSESAGEDRAYIRNLAFHVSPAFNVETAGTVPIETSPIEDCITISDGEFTRKETTDRFGETYDIFYTKNHEGYSSASMYIDVYQSGILFFEALPLSESGCDGIRVYVNDEEKHFISGTSEFFSTYTLDVRVGDSVRLTYSKDGSVTQYDDTVYIRNFRFAIIEPTDNLFGFGEIVDFESYIDGETEVWVSKNDPGDDNAYLTYYAKESGYLYFDYTLLSKDENYRFLVLKNEEAVITHYESGDEYHGRILVNAGDKVTFLYIKEIGQSIEDYSLTIWNLMLSPN